MSTNPATPPAAPDAAAAAKADKKAKPVVKEFTTARQAKSETETVEITSGVIYEGHDLQIGDICTLPGWFGRQLVAEGRAKKAKVATAPAAE